MLPAMEPNDQVEIARISRALLRTVKKAVSLMDAEEFGEELLRILSQAWELRARLCQEQTNAADGWVTEELQTMCKEIGATLKRIESLLDEELSQETAPKPLLRSR
jgi:hypothetical protein